MSILPKGYLRGLQDNMDSLKKALLIGLLGALSKLEGQAVYLATPEVFFEVAGIMEAAGSMVFSWDL